VKIAGRREFLADQARAYDFSISLDQLSAGAAREEQLRYACDRERIEDTKDHRGNQREPNGCNKVLFHEFP
jgi:hypothetical protein